MTKHHFDVALFNQDFIRLSCLMFSPLFKTLPDISGCLFVCDRTDGGSCLADVRAKLFITCASSVISPLWSIQLLNRPYSRLNPFVPPSSPTFSLSPVGQRVPGPSPTAPLRVKWNFSDLCLHKELQLVTLLPRPPPAAAATPQPVRVPVSGCRRHQRAHSKP